MANVSNSASRVRLVVSADDFGYYDAVSKGILETIQFGVVTATAVLANGPRFEPWAKQLASEDGVDCGVHLNLSWGTPVTSGMRDALAGDFKNKWAMVNSVVFGAIGLDLVRHEWQAQVERALDCGLQIRFLNSHEHIHLIPPLAGVMHELAIRFGIKWRRQLEPEWRHGQGFAGHVRNLSVKLLAPRNQAGSHGIPCLGLGPSGKLDLDYLSRRLEELPSGAYELMCHPGRDDPAEITDGRLRRYHAWEQEWALLRSVECRQLFSRLGVEPVRFSDLAQ